MTVNGTYFVNLSLKTQLNSFFVSCDIVRLLWKLVIEKCKALYGKTYYTFTE